ncbi:hypothetical protein SDC9_186926 [bioreactor metagenome]|uniref:Uncharacterized protein n=1 Tax=bioreactor metagenome TaxID=1076179 RepID=A0A645HK53_9ZZZZ
MLELVLWCAADALHLLGRVALVVLLHQLVDAARVLQRRISLDVAVFAELVVPGLLVVGALFFVVAGEDAIHEFKVIAHDEAEVRVVVHVLVMDLVVGEQVVDHTAQEDDVTARPDRGVEVRHRG